MDWIAHNHGLFTHLPFAVAVLLPVALAAAQRPGRGIKPWWITCRYLAWSGVLGAAMAALSGFQQAQASNRLPGSLMPGGLPATPMQFHIWCALASLLLGVLTVRALHRKRQDHQGIGLLGLFLGLLFATAAIAAGYSGTRMAHPPPAPPKVVKPPDPEADAPLRALDYARLVPMHVEPVKSPPHGNRWIRAWVSPAVAAAYRAGDPLPEGALVVLSTLEDRWGKPGYEQGPLYALEIAPGGKPRLTFYWPRVPESKRNEAGGARAYWRGDDPGLTSCLTCHAGGAAPLQDRSKWAIPKPKSQSGADR